MTALAKSAGPVLVGLALLAVALVLAVQYIDTYDSTCGTVLYPTTRSLRPCPGLMLGQRVLVSLFVMSGFGVIAGPIAWRMRRRPAWAFACVASLGAALVLGVVASRAVALPRSGCGSVVNQVRYEGQEETGPRACGPYWSKQLRVGVTSGIAAVALATVGIAVPALARGSSPHGRATT